MANESDVKVKLSAEGVAEVVAAFRKIATEGKRAGEEAGKGMETLHEATKEVAKELLSFATIGFAIEKVKDLFKETLEGAEHFEKLSQKTGMSTSALQGYAQAAREAGVNNEVLDTTLTKFDKSIVGAIDGNAKFADSFSKLGINIRDLKAQSPDAIFAVVAKRLAELPDGYEKAALAQSLFGKSGADLIPVLNELAEKGLDHYIEKLKQLGVFLDTDSIRSMKAAGDSLKDVNDEVKGLATQFLVGLVPSLQAGADELVKATSSGTNGFKSLGEGVGAVIKFIELGFITLGTDVGTIAANIAENFTYALQEIKATAVDTFTVIKQFATGDFKGSSATAANANARAAARQASHQDAIKAMWEQERQTLKEAHDRLFPDGPPEAHENYVKKDGAEGGGITSADEKLGKARLSLIEAQLQAQLAVYKAQSSLREAQEKQDFDNGLLTLQKYYDDRRTIATTEAAKELQILQTRRGAIAALPVGDNDPAAGIAKQTQLAQIDGQIAVQKIQAQARLAQLTQEQGAAAKKMADDQLAAEQKLLTIQGQRFAAARIGLQQELDKLDEILRKSGASDGDRQAALDIAQRQGEAKIKFDELRAQAQTQLTELDTQIQAIHSQVENGLIFQAQGEQRILDLERQRLPILQQIGTAMTGTAQKTGLDQATAQAGEYNAKVGQIVTATNTAGQAMAHLKQVGQDAFQNGIATFLDDIISKSESVGDAFKKMALGMIQQILAITEKEIALKIIESIGFSDGGHVGFDGGGYTGSGGKYEPAGIVHKGEYVLPQEVVQKPGMLQMLQALHTGMLTPRAAPSPSMAGYAAGGVVAGSQTNFSVNPRIINVLDPSTLGDHLTTPEGEQAIINVISRNPSRVNQALR